MQRKFDTSPTTHINTTNATIRQHVIVNMPTKTQMQKTEPTKRNVSLMYVKKINKCLK